jgi:hypothetical protein
MASLKKNSRPDLPDLAKDFLKEEQKQRRQEIENLIGRIESDKQYGLIITGLIWSWLATNREKLQAPFDLVVVFIPAFLMLFFLWRWRALDMTVYRVAKYTEDLEWMFAVPEGFGWETWLNGIRRETVKRDPLTTSSYWYWILLVVGNLVLAGLFMWFTRWEG